MKLIWSPLALQRFEEIIDYIGADSPSNAERFANSILESVRNLNDFPKSGRIVEEI